MILFPSAKINLGLWVTAKRNDGFHNIESIFYPIPMHDAIEFRESSKFKLNIFGLSVPGKLSENLLVKAWELLHRHYQVPLLEINLLKAIPVGSGLGGGSADAAFFLKALNNFFQLNIKEDELLSHAAQIGSDCPFFIRNKPAFVTGRGDFIRPCRVNLKGFYLMLVVPHRPLSTATLFSKIKPVKRKNSLSEIIKLPVKQWQPFLTNDFEKIVFRENPVMAKTKNALLHQHALYASMTGTGSAVYGLFNTNPDTETLRKYGTIYKYRL